MNGTLGAIIGMGGLTIINVVAVAYFYGRLCGKVEFNSWRITKLWRRVFNSNDEEEYHESR